VQVFFDGFAAPLFFVSAAQINAQASYAVAGKTLTEVQSAYKGKRSNVVKAKVDYTSPGCFAGEDGQAAALNENGTRNSRELPADRGRVVALFCTGEGQCEPPGVDGAQCNEPLRTPLRPCSLEIGRVPAKVSYCGCAPGMVGVVQVNAVVPEGLSLSTSPALVPVVFTVGGNSSPSTVTIWVR
jgi:uncharacterized protein (TIGR03437 family)